MKFFPFVILCVGWWFCAEARAADVPLSPGRTAINQIPAGITVVEAWINGRSTLKVTPTGLSWFCRDEKTGSHGGIFEPTYIDNQPWKPVWDPVKREGLDLSSEYPLPSKPLTLKVLLLAVTSTHGGEGVDPRDPLDVVAHDENLHIYFRDGQEGARWYRIALGEESALMAYAKTLGLAPVKIKAGLLAEPPSPVAAGQQPNSAVIIEALIDGSSALRVTHTGIYWYCFGDKPGKHDRKDEPTFINGQPWKPVWGNPDTIHGIDNSQEFPMVSNPAVLKVQLLAVSDHRGGQGILRRDPIESKMVGDQFSVFIPDGQNGACWYRFAIGDEASLAALAAGAPPAAPTSTAQAPTSPPPSLVPISTDGAITAAELVKTYRNSLVFVNGDQGSGSGFLATYATGNYVFTNAHVAAGIKGAGFKTLEGTSVKVGAASVAVGHDIFLLQTNLNGKPFEVMKGVDQNTTIGDEVVVLGNAEGAGVINTITGKIVGVGPQLVEVDAPFVPGNSGSPIIHLKTGKVIGVATYLTIKKYDPATKQAVHDPIVRRFGYRIDSVKTWQPVNWPALYAQAAEMDGIEKLTDDLDTFLMDLGKDGRVNTGAHTNPLIKNRIDAWLKAKGRQASATDRNSADQSFLSFLKVTCQTDVTAARQHMTYDYFQRALADQQQTRNQMSDFFSKIIDDLKKDR